MDFVLKIDIRWEARNSVQDNIYLPAKEHRDGRGVLMMPAAGIPNHTHSYHSTFPLAQLNIITHQIVFIEGKYKIAST